MLGTKRVKWMMQTIIDCLKATEVQVDVALFNFRNVLTTRRI